jgi:catechol 2,3-dioxygenase-like lactoylglutathione lyase family enzyme
LPRSDDGNLEELSEPERPRPAERAARRTILRVTSRPASAQHLRDLALLRRVRDRIDREYAQPLDVEALPRGAHMSATYGWILLATKDLDGTFEQLQASDAEVVQEPTEQPYGVRDCAVRDPAGNLIRIQELA